MAQTNSFHGTTAGVTVHVPDGQHPLPVGAGQPVTKTGTAVSGQVSSKGIVGPIINNPA